MSVIANMHRRTIRGPVNPIDKSTIVSILPKHIKEVKPTIQPGYFEIPPGSPDDPQVLVVGPSSWWRDVGLDQPIIEIPNGSTVVAESVVRDYCSGLLMCDMEENMPGLFWVPGAFSLKEIQEKFKDALKDAVRRQINWFGALVNLADTGWARSNGNPMTISDDMRMAAKMLGMSKDWMANTTAMENIRCVACGALRNPAYPICGHCHMIVDKEKAEKLGIIAAPATVKA